MTSSGLVAFLVAAPDDDPGGESASDAASSTLRAVIEGTWDNIIDNPTQTGIALFLATLITVALLNQRVNIFLVIPTSIGAFWGAWLGYNTVVGEDNELFPSDDLETTKLWDIATEDEWSFLITAVVASLAALFLWRTKLSVLTRVLILFSAVLGASFVYNLYEALAN